MDVKGLLHLLQMSWDTQRAALRAEKCQLQAKLATLRRQIAEREGILANSQPAQSRA